MRQLTFAYPEELMLSLGGVPEAVCQEVRLAAAMKFYELGRLSSGGAANLAGVPRPLFLSKLGDYGVAAFDVTEEELREDVDNA